MNDLIAKPKLDIPRVRFPIDDLVISLFKECTPRILVVTDGSLSFGASNFGLSDFINTLKTSTIHGMTPIVKTAHRGGSAADHTNFTFSSSTLSISKYDVVFLFGFNGGGSLPAAEVSVITKFMNDGGGVFATGDHATLGKQLCGDIPRVRGMRRWNGPTASGVDRISTNDPGTNNEFTFGDQSDVIPQKIYPAYSGTMANNAPHYLLQHPTKKIIEVLPDHPHESECLVPNNLSDASEWPKDSGGNTVSPELAALSMSYGGGFTGKQPISEPRSFGAIGAYDGHKASVGRISTDATWHHFININIIASAAGPGLAGNPDAYDRVSTYFENIARWLMPKKVRKCLRWPIIIKAKELYPIAEFIPQLLDNPEDIDTLLEVGREMQNTLARFITPGERQELVEDLFELHNENLAIHVKSQRNKPANLEELIGQKMAPIDMLEQAAWGAVVLAAATALPADGDLEANLKSAGNIDGLDKQVKTTLKQTFKNLSDELRKGRNQLDLLLEYC